MNLMGLLMKVHNQQTRRTNWMAYRLGRLAGIVPWITIAIALAWQVFAGALNTPI